nr:hypothetical protein [Tanacetum cinerariifolium]
MTRKGHDKAGIVCVLARQLFIVAAMVNASSLFDYNTSITVFAAMAGSNTEGECFKLAAMKLGCFKMLLFALWCGELLKLAAMMGYVECDDLAQRAKCLKEESASQRVEASHIRSKYEQLLAENASLRNRVYTEDESEESRGSNVSGKH